MTTEKLVPRLVFLITAVAFLLWCVLFMFIFLAALVIDFLLWLPAYLLCAKPMVFMAIVLDIGEGMLKILESAEKKAR